MAYRQERFPGARRVLAQDAVPRFELRRTMMARLLPQNPALSLLLLFGDVEMEQLDLDPRAGEASGPGSFSRTEPDVHGLVIVGDLLVHGTIHQADAPTGLSLYVLGSLTARNVAISALELVVRDSVTVKEALCGSGSLGGARLDAGVQAKLLISDGFPMLIGGRLSAPVLDTGRTRIGVVENDRVREARGDVPPGIVLADSVLTPVSEGGRLSVSKLRAQLAAGRPVLSADYLSGRTDLAAIRELRRLAREIDSALEEGRYIRGAHLLRQARAKGAPRAETALKLADAIYRVHHRSGQLEPLREALDLLNEALGPSPAPVLLVTCPRAPLQRAQILLQLHEFDDDAFEQAWRDLNLAAVTLPAADRGEVAGLMGQWLFGRHRYLESVPYLRQALFAHPDDGVTHGRLARALWMLDREAEALPHAGRSIELNPVDDRMWFVRGKCHQVVGDTGAARKDLETYLDRNPDDEMAVEALVEVDLAEGRTDDAVSRARAFIRDYPGVEGLPARFGRLFHMRGLHDSAVPLLRRAMEAEPERDSSVVDLAVAITGAGRERPGLVTALRSTEVDPDGNHLAYLRAEVYLALQQPARAERDLVDYTARFPDAARALASLAGIRLTERRTEEAESLLSAASRVAPDDDYVRDIAERAGLVPNERFRVARRAHVIRPL